MDALHLSSLEHFSVWDFVLPLDSEKAPEASHVEGIELSCMSTVDCPGFAGIEQRRKHHCTVNLELCFNTQSSPLPYIISQSAEG